MRFSDFDLAFSFTEEAEPHVKHAYSFLDEYNVYYYKKVLREQWGMSVGSLASDIYSNVPCVVWLNESWTVSAATRLERDFLLLSEQPLLVLKEFPKAQPIEARCGPVTVIVCEQFDGVRDGTIVLDWFKALQT